MTNHDPTTLERIAETAMRERGLLTTPPPQVLTEVEAVTSTPVLQQVDERTRDLRGLLWSSIDNQESQDLDQIELCEQTADGFRLLVGIADVDYCAKAGSATDRFAGHNTTSVYTGVRTFPMLPERLSYDRTSLLDNQPRLAVIIETVVHLDGTLGPSQIYRALIRNHAKLDYPTVSAWLEHKGPPPSVAVAGLLPQLQLQDELARRLAQARARAGALDFDTGEVRAVMDCEGHVLDVAPRHPGRASRLIEELMIASNVSVARALCRANLPALRRVVKKPERWARIVAYAAERGFTLPQTPSSQELGRFLAAMRSSKPLAEFAEISVALVKLMGRGEYVAYAPGQPDGDRFGHFGLAAEQYTHATAPNRRYPDLITQRLLGCLLAGRPSPYSMPELAALADHCSQREADAQKVERRVRKSLQAQLLASRIGERFTGLITGASAKGTWARLSAPTAEGRVVAGEAGLQVGDHVNLRLRSVNVERGYIDLVAE